MGESGDVRRQVDPPGFVWSVGGYCYRCLSCGMLTFEHVPETHECRRRKTTE